MIKIDLDIVYKILVLFIVSMVLGTVVMASVWAGIHRMYFLGTGLVALFIFGIIGASEYLFDGNELD